MEEKYTVWVGGTEVNDHYLTKENAEILAEKFKAEGYVSEVKVQIYV